MLPNARCNEEHEEQRHPVARGTLAAIENGREPAQLFERYRGVRREGFQAGARDRGPLICEVAEPHAGQEPMELAGDGGQGSAKGDAAGKRIGCRAGHEVVPAAVHFMEKMKIDNFGAKLDPNQSRG
jgi:hypothetical protein